jgi:hypothetical protein
MHFDPSQNQKVRKSSNIVKETRPKRKLRLGNQGKVDTLKTMIYESRTILFVVWLHLARAEGKELLEMVFSLSSQRIRFLGLRKKGTRENDFRQSRVVGASLSKRNGVGVGVMLIIFVGVILIVVVAVMLIVYVGLGLILIVWLSM